MIKSEKNKLEHFDIDEYIIQNNYTEKMINWLKQFHKIVSNTELKIQTDKKELFILKNDKMICKTKTLKNRIQLNIFVFPEILNLNPTYEEFKDSKIVIEFSDNYKIWEIIQTRLN